MVSNNRLQSIWTGFARTTGHSSYVSEEDISSFRRRFESEGPEYYARGFTALRHSLLLGLETGRLEVKGRFGPKRGTVLPRFIYTAWAAIFNTDGTLRVDYDTGAVACLNQLLAVFGKISGGHTPESETRVIRDFVAVEATLAATSVDEEMLIGKVPLRNILDSASGLIARVIGRHSPRDISPKHGTGVSACRLPQWQRYGEPRYVEKIDRIWNYSEYYYASLSHLVDSNAIDSLDSYDPVARVLLVPKDARGPRLISCEPRETMWIQQGLMAKLYTVIEEHPLTKRKVNFTDQSYNQRAAHFGSLIRALATLDLSEASDRLRLDVVQRLVPKDWSDALMACRSEYTELPDGRVIRMHKHAPMGSATCFPVMALCIWAVLTAALPQDRNILVYGDDIVVSSVNYDRAVQVLEAIHLKVNVTKSYVKGPYRESCGKEYIDGIDITPVRVRKMPADNGDAQASTISFSNNLFDKYGTEPEWMTTLIRTWYRNVLERTYDPTTRKVTTHSRYAGGNLTYSRSEVYESTLYGALNVHLASNQHLRSRWNPRLQRREYRVLVPKSRELKYPVDNWCVLFRALVNPRSEDPLGVDALKKRVSYKYQWVPAVF